MKLAGKVAVVTGAASGLGAAIARAYAAEGARIAIADLNAEAAERMAAELRAAGGEAMGLGLDVTSEDQVTQGIDAVATAFGGIDILVSNAGFQHLDSIADVSFDNWKRIMAVHLDGGFLTTRAALRHMYAQGRGGNVILMGSIHSKEASVSKGPYVVAKHGLLGLCRTVAKGARPTACVPT